MDWKKITEQPTKSYGWFGVAVTPRNNGEIRGELNNDWRALYGFTKAWLNNGSWFEADAHGHGMRNITDRVTHWSELPQVPELTEPHESNYNNFLERDRNGKEYLTKLAMQQWEEDAKTNPDVANPTAYVYGFISAFRLMGIR